MTRLRKWKLITETDVSPSKWFPLFKHKVQLPNGNIVDDYYVSKLGDVSMIVPVTKDKKLIFVRQYKHGAGELTLEFPAGRVGGNTFEKAAELELKEETGYTAKKFEYLGFFHHTPSKDTAVVKGYLCRDLDNQGEQNLDMTEEIEIVRVPLKEVTRFVEEGKISGPDTLAFLYLAKLHAPELFK